MANIFLVLAAVAFATAFLKLVKLFADTAFPDSTWPIKYANDFKEEDNEVVRAKQIVFQREADVMNAVQLERFETLWPGHDPMKNRIIESEYKDDVRIEHWYYKGVCRQCGDRHGKSKTRKEITKAKQDAQYNDYSEVTIDSLLDSTILFKTSSVDESTINASATCPLCLDIQSELEYARAVNLLEERGIES